ncbi:hypothetical protein [Streptomyces aidingensis]|uniref:DUF7848 domain-containing protein n=1 Tax=Streptomyces aidingensis TaxID=910347 RepID=A0A1I1QMR4_9ACTN|nr:hypothetical protein [Streptomyces aidingensis]SFD23272.1 hypothetical protein SAMN05421773_111182 [Streptomyces aidingensis]
MREVHGVRRFTVALDTEPDAEPVTFAMQCVVCGQSGRPVELASGASDVEREAARRRAALWVKRHRDRNREHFTYRLVETSPYRLVPGDWR